MPDSVIQCIEAAATSKNMDMSIEFYSCDLQPFEIDEDDGENLESSSTYSDIPVEMPGVSIKTNTPAASIHDELNLFDDFPEASIAAADNAGLKDPWLAPADDGVVVTDTASDDEDMMDDENFFTWPANYHDPGLDEDHRSENDSPDEIDEYNEPTSKASQTTRSVRVLRQPVWMTEYQ